MTIFFLTTLLSPLEAQEPAAGISEFDAQAFAALPIEKSYTFTRALAESQWQLRRDPQAQPTPGSWPSLRVAGCY